MAFNKSALGNRHTCYKCEAKFYDMNGDPVCPSCQADQREGDSISAGEAFLETLSKHKRKSAKTEEAVVAEENTGLEEESDGTDDDDDDDDDEDELLASLSGEDDEAEEEEEL